MLRVNLFQNNELKVAKVPRSLCGFTDIHSCRSSFDVMQLEEFPLTATAAVLLMRDVASLGCRLKAARRLLWPVLLADKST